jgi:hypothetical protein
MVYGWVGGKHACVNLTEVSPIVGLRAGTFTAGQTVLKVASICNYYIFINISEKIRI